MSVQTDLEKRTATLQGILDETNEALAEKNAAEADNLAGIPAAVRAIEMKQDLQLEDVYIEPSDETQVVEPSKGYDGIGSVTVYPAELEMNLEDVYITPTEEEQTVYPSKGYDAIGSVTVGAAEGGGGGGSSGPSMPGFYRPYFNVAEKIYTDGHGGEYSHVAIAENEKYISIHFLTDDFELVTYDEDTTEYTATGIAFVTYVKETGQWSTDVVDNTGSTSGGGRFISHWIYSDVDVIWGNTVVFESVGTVERGRAAVSGATSLQNGVYMAQVSVLPTYSGNKEVCSAMELPSKVTFNGVTHKAYDIFEVNEDIGAPVFGNPFLLNFAGYSYDDNGLDFCVAYSGEIYGDLVITRGATDFTLTYIFEGRVVDVPVFNEYFTSTVDTSTYNAPVGIHTLGDFSKNLKGFVQAIAEYDTYSSHAANCYVYPIKYYNGGEGFHFGDECIIGKGQYGGDWQEQQAPYAPFYVVGRFEGETLTNANSSVIYTATTQNYADNGHRLKVKFRKYVPA